MDRLHIVGLEFELVETGETGRLRYDARDLMKLDPYGYVQQVRSSRRLDLENECRRLNCFRDISIPELFSAENAKRCSGKSEHSPLPSNHGFAS